MGMVPIEQCNAARRYGQIRQPFEKAASEIYSTGRFIDGPYADQLAAKLLTRKKYQYCTLTSSGTAALYILALYYRNSFDTILTTPYTFRATHQAFEHAGYKVVHTPVDRELRLGDWSGNTQGRMLNVLVGVFGAQPTKYRKTDPSVMDGCQNWIGANVDMPMAISFDPTKIIASNGNGGALLTNDANLWQCAEQMVRHGHYGMPGLNMRMSELECAYVLPQLDLLDEWMEKRRKVAKHYIDHFNDLIVGYQAIDDPTHDWQKVVIKSFDGPRFQERCRREGVMVKRLHYKEPWGAHEDPTTAYALPIYPELTTSEMIKLYCIIRDSYC